MDIKELKIKYDYQDNEINNIDIPVLPKKGLVALVGGSGSGKTTILKSWFGEKYLQYDKNINTIEQFKSLDNGEKLLNAFGLRSIPTWFRPIKTLSNGELHRALCALSVDKEYKFVDEFTSFVDRDTAKSLCVALRKHIKQDELFVVATCHKDIISWLQPDFVIDLDSNGVMNGRCLRRPKMSIRIRVSEFKNWVYYKKHHYLNSSVSKSCHFFEAFFDEKPVAFLAVIHGTARDIKSYWRESRIVVIPEFQGLGIGINFSEAIADEYIKNGLRYFAKTSHPALGEHRNKSDKWRNTSTNMMKRKSYLKLDGTARKQKGYGKTEKEILRDFDRVCYSHEYIGKQAQQDVAPKV